MDLAAPSLFPNQFVNVRLQLGEREGVLIPVTAVRTGPEGHYVYVVDEAGVAHTRAVTPGMASAEAVLDVELLHWRDEHLWRRSWYFLSGQIYPKYHRTVPDA